ncbi:hypothetical protein H4219_003382 [Mycoemilia scoparia]|uniref:Uncharacterized protein n=1 Tax=Mycoemilia scoparia TaxID=417184 RepID=A0A9W8A089_9FUNG|nr:hypothetical protein H4219_003382 [Mycoemilia scoparia]
MACYEKKQTFGSMGKLGEILFEKSAFYYMVFLLSLQRYTSSAPCPPHDDSISTNSSNDDDDDTQLENSKLDHLPVEIICQMFEKISNDKDKIKFAQTSPDIAKKIYYYLATKYGWAGKRIALFGDYSYTVPPQLQDIHESDERATASDRRVRGGSFYDDVNKNSEEINYYQLQNMICIAKIALGKDYFDLNKDDREFMVCCETRKEYVYCNRNNLTRNLICLICWSDDTSMCIQTDLAIYRGDWAWNKLFVVFPSSNHFDFSGWKDITEEVKRQVDYIVETDRALGE